MRDRFAWKMVAGLALLAVLIGAMIPSASAAGWRAGDVVRVDEGEVVDDDLYAAGAQVIIDGTVTGDLFAAGSSVTVNGTVEGDVMAAAQYVSINGTVGDDVRAAAQIISLGRDSEVASDVLAAGFAFDAPAGSLIGQDLLVAGYQARVAGDLGRNLRGGLGALEISGAVGGDVVVEVDSGAADGGFTGAPPFMGVEMLPPGLRITDDAQIGGELVYTSPSRADIPEDRIEGDVVYQTPVPAPQTEQQAEVEPRDVAAGGATAVLLAVLSWIWAQVRRFLTLLLIGSVLFWIVPVKMREIATTLREKPWPSLGWGFVGSIGFWVAFWIVFAVIIMVTIFLAVIQFGNLATAVFVVGMIGDLAFLVAFLVAWFWIAKVVFAFVGGLWLLRRFRADWDGPWIWPLLIGVALFTVVRAIPCLGFVIDVILTFFGLGAILIWGRNRWRPEETEA